MSLSCLHPWSRQRRRGRTAFPRLELLALERRELPAVVMPLFASMAPIAFQTPPGVPAQTAFSFTDPNPQTVAENFTAQVDWGDRTASFLPVSPAGTDGTFRIDADHTYTAEGDYAVRVVVFSVDGRELTITGTAMVLAGPVIIPPPPDGNSDPGTDPGEAPIPAPTPVPSASSAVSSAAAFSPPLLVTILAPGDAPVPNVPDPPLAAAPLSFLTLASGEPTGRSNKASVSRATRSGGTDAEGDEPTTPEAVIETPSVLERLAPLLALDQPRPVQAEDAVFLDPASVDLLGVATEDELFLIASAGASEAECILGEPLPLLALEELPEEEALRSPSLLGDELILFTLLWFVATAFVTIYEPQ